MLPFDQLIKSQNFSEAYIACNYNYPTNFTYTNSPFPWNMDYARIQSQHYVQPSNYYFLPQDELPAADEMKQASQPTRSSQNYQQISFREIQIKTQIQQLNLNQNERQKQEKVQQKYGRNIISNILHMTLRKMLSTEFIGNIAKAIQFNRMTITVNQFKERLIANTKGMKGYINMKKIKRLLIGNPIGATKMEIEFRGLLRILSRMYIHNYHIPHIYHTGKIKKYSREFHIANLRRLSLKKKK